jgi:hypothetical protein
MIQQIICEDALKIKLHVYTVHCQVFRGVWLPTGFWIIGFIDHLQVKLKQL